MKLLEVLTRSCWWTGKIFICDRHTGRSGAVMTEVIPHVIQLSTGAPQTPHIDLTFYFFHL